MHTIELHPDTWLALAIADALTAQGEHELAQALLSSLAE
jgi:hypothetical protein